MKNENKKINELLQFFNTVTVFTDDGIEEYKKEDTDEVDSSSEE